MKYNLSEVTEIIRNRRTIRPEDYTSRKVHRELVEHVLNNALWAPTHGMTQPWRYKVFMGDALDRLAFKLPEIYKNWSGENFSEKKYEKIRKRCSSVSVMIFICMDRDPDGRIPEIEEVEAVACSVQNMYLTATAYGIGAYWSSPKYMYGKEMHDFLELKADSKCLGIFYLGYPAIEWPASHRKPLEYVSEWIDQ